MALYPEIVAGYEAAKTILADTGVRLEDPTVIRTGFPTDPIGIMASFPPAYSVDAHVLREGINVGWVKRFGLGNEFRLVEYPVPYTDPDFVEKLREPLLAAVADFKAKAQAEKLKDFAQDAPGDVYEARDAIREVK